MTGAGLRVRLTDLPTRVHGFMGGGAADELERWTDEATGRILLFKRYHEHVAASAVADVLVEIVDWARTHPGARPLLPSLALPIHVVLDGPRVAGVVLEQAGPEYFTGEDYFPVRSLDWISLPYAVTHRQGRPYFEPPHKLALLGRLLLLIADLHDEDTVVGDLSALNVLVTADRTSPQVLLLDCDSWFLGRRHAFPTLRLRQIEYPGAGFPFSARADWYRAGQIVVGSLMEAPASLRYDERWLRRFLPGPEIRLLGELLDPERPVSPRRIRGMAAGWIDRLRPDGSMTVFTSVGGQVSWPPGSDLVRAGAPPVHGPFT